jgi:hypothetical protein
MNYEQKYKEALKVIRSLYNMVRYLSSSNALFASQTIEKAFPELKESEDERIRKEIIQFLQLPHPQFVGKRDHKEWIAWLEKQGEQKSIDMIEPKFKVGDWITNGACIIKITSIDDRYYWHDNDCVGGDIESIDKEYHLWTIKDAKDGDVLFTTCDNINEIVFIYHGIDPNVANCYFLYSKTNNECKTFNSICSVKADIHPATKEQRDLLFSKLKEAGY